MPVDAQRRLDAMERDEPKRRLIRDAKALAKTRKITQAQMAEEMGVPHRTLEEWLQFRRMPKAPGTTLLRRWVETYHREEL
ncbi:helix-turn-helix domain-containing protein [Halomonas sp. ANAO-440]|uniref:helix-turn-helix transcriptional regulator n=1 Tax=Halomonas sp. ANAO-440 TaxID=2861360 RepID=UPI001CAA46BA|nr:helix-turn-helix transcriptional regulator [Halomonas sp. ANAO-440]MBZ0330664.1 helix-turn-helix domain-containing protein [Halomonas sp. ANAO-440]